MSEIIDIIIAVDTANLMTACPNPSQNPNTPTWIGHNFAYMIAANEYVRSGQATGDLSISADINDSVRWRMLSFSGNSSYSAGIMNVTYLSGNQVTSPVEGRLSQPQTPVPGTTPGSVALPPTFVTTPQFDYFLTADIVTFGTENYSVVFAVMTYTKGALKTLGYFAWDPQIVAS